MNFVFEHAPGIDKEATDFSATLIESGGEEPQIVLRENQAWMIKVRWQEQGDADIPGNWVVDAYAESIGPGPELHLGQRIDAFAGLYSWHEVNIPVASATVLVAAGQQTTPYKLIYTLTANNGAGKQYAMAGFQEGPIIQVFQSI